MLAYRRGDNGTFPACPRLSAPGLKLLPLQIKQERCPALAPTRTGTRRLSLSPAEDRRESWEGRGGFLRLTKAQRSGERASAPVRAPTGETKLLSKTSDALRAVAPGPQAPSPPTACLWGSF